MIDLFTQFATGWFEYFTLQSVYATAILLVVWPVSRLLRNRSAYWRYGLWMLVFIRLIIPPQTQLPFSARDLLERLDLTLLSADRKIDRSELESQFGHDEPVSQNFSTIPQIKINPDKNAVNFLFLFWIAGTGVFTARYIRQRRFLRQIIYTAEKVEGERIVQIVEKWRRYLSIKKHIFVYSSSSFQVPFTIGVQSPVIFIPEYNLNKENIEAAIAHEMVHIHRRDDFWVLLQNVLQIMYFFLPVIWIVNRKLQQEREYICDYKVLLSGKIPAVCYGKALYELIQTASLNTRYRMSVLSFGNQFESVRYRLKQILEVRKMRTNRNFVIILLTLFAVFTLPMAQETKTDNQKMIKAEPLNQLEAIKTEFKLPINEGIISSRFGKRMHPIHKIERHHDGIDVAAKKGTPIYASADGLVSHAGLNGGYGKMIVIIHQAGYITRYGQLDTIIVEVDQTVERGEQIGTVGNSGLSTAPHLHFELRLNDKPIDPQKQIDFSGLSR